jgi:hypothetical protein
MKRAIVTAWYYKDFEDDELTDPKALLDFCKEVLDGKTGKLGGWHSMGSRLDECKTVTDQDERKLLAQYGLHIREVKP